MKKESQDKQNNTPIGFSTMTSSVEFAHNYNSWILKEFAPFFGEQILEIGTGQGNFKNLVHNSCSTYVSIDIDDEVIARAKERDSNGIYLNLSIIDTN